MIRKLNKGVSLVEVMAALVIALVIAIGMMSYQYAGAQHARKTDVRVTGSRIGLLFLESWVAAGGIADVGIYDPSVKLGLGFYPLGNYEDLETEVLTGAPPPNGLPFRLYSIFTNGTYFWVELAYDDEYLPDEVYPIRELGVRIAWSLDFEADELVYDPQRLIRFSKSVIYSYVPPT